MTVAPRRRDVYVSPCRPSSHAPPPPPYTRTGDREPVRRPLRPACCSRGTVRGTRRRVPIRTLAALQRQPIKAQVAFTAAEMAAAAIAKQCPPHGSPPHHRTTTSPALVRCAPAHTQGHQTCCRAERLRKSECIDQKQLLQLNTAGTARQATFGRLLALLGGRCTRGGLCRCPLVNVGGEGAARGDKGTRPHIKRDKMDACTTKHDGHVRNRSHGRHPPTRAARSCG